jgi:uncharacterized surface protein with fasciclin (FAS1) repeats
MNKLITWAFAGLILVGLPAATDPDKIPAPATATCHVQGNTIMETIISSRQRPLLTQLLTTAGLVPVLSGGGPFTLFAPSEEALRKIQSEDPERLRTILSHHIVQGNFAAADLKEGVPIPTMCGKTVTVMRKKDRIMVSGVTITNPDMAANNGVIHGMADVIMP